jgi:bifunctional oligoribonuclease and PAP phosphatase NrnA
MSVTNPNPVRMDAMPTSELLRTFREARRILVVSHIDPDGDAIGTQLAFGEYLRSIGKQVFMLRDSEIPDKYRFLPRVGLIVTPDALPEDFAVDTAVILECPSAARIGSIRKYLLSGVTTVNIDHHRDNEYFGSINWVDVRPSSVGEMAYEFFATVGYKLSPQVAESLYTAILTDTGRFRFASTSPRTMTIAGELIAAGASPKKVCEEVYFNGRPSTLKLMGKVLNGIEFHNNGKTAILLLTKEMLVSAEAAESEADGLVDFTMSTRGVVAGALLKELDSRRTKVSLRSSDGVNVSAVAYRFGGGGHFNAAGCIVPKPLEEAKQEIIALLAEADDATA